MSTDRTTVRLVVAFLGVLAVLGMGLGGWLAADGKAVPDFVIAATSASLGALSALLARVSDEPVAVTAPPDAPLPVTDVAEAASPPSPPKRRAKS